MQGNGYGDGRGDRDDDEFDAWSPRPPHRQRFKVVPEPKRTAFDGTQFIAYLVGVRNGKLGGIILTLEVPPDFIQHATPLLEVVSVPLSVDVQPWEIAKEENV